MELTEDQIKFLNKVCKGTWTLNENGEVDVEKSVYMDCANLTEIPVKFGRVGGFFSCSDNKLTTLKNCPNYINSDFYCLGNNLTEYFKNIKESDFKFWDRLYWSDGILEEYPFLVNIGKKYFDRDALNLYLKKYPKLKLYLED
jgi:hypothetical protein